MKLLRGAASILTLALFVMPVHAAADQTNVEPIQIAQAADAALPPEVQAILAEQRGVGDLSIEELKTRAAQALAYSQDQSLPQDIRDQLKSLGDAANANLAARTQVDPPAAPAAEPAPAVEAPKAEAAPAAEPAPVVEAPKVEAAPAVEAPKVEAAPAVEAPKVEAAPAVEPAPAVEAPKAEAAPVVEAPKAEAAPAVEPAPVVEAPKAEVAPAPAVALPEEVTALLADTRTAAELTNEEIQTRATSARRFAKDESLPQDVRDQLAAMAAAAHDEFVIRKQNPAAAQKAAEPAAPIIVQEAPAPAVDAAAAPTIAPVAPPLPAPTAAEVKALDGNAGNPEIEKKAQTYLADATPLDKLSDVDLRSRLDGVRDLLSSNQLSSATEKSVRDKLQSEREVLRSRLAQAEATQAVQQTAKQPAPAPVPAAELAAISAAPLPPVPVQPPAPKAVAGTTTNNATVNNTTINNTTIITNVTPVQVVLQDRRPPEQLQLSELQRRVQVYDEAQYNQNYDVENRDYWRASVARDREILRRRMIAERRARAEQLALNANIGGLDFTIGINFDATRPPPPRAVFAAEIDEQEMQDVLIAAPRMTIKKRYSLDEIAAEPKLRNTVSRIEIDTIRFGSNEAFIREEQMDSLGGVGAIIERIVKKYPNEVFLIEGHTDARGTDAYNIKLSKARAEAVKTALTEYYVIPAKNLRTVGLGERFLKIPTADAEPENRRVSIARITQLLSRAQ